MSSLDFVRLVKDMRDAQRHYFKTKDKRALQASCDLEKRVDRVVKVKTDLMALFPAMREDGANTHDLDQLRADKDRLTNFLAVATDLLAKHGKLTELEKALEAHGL